MTEHIQSATDSGIGGKIQKFIETGTDIRLLGWLFIVSGIIDFFWILSYPDYALKVFGTTFSGWIGVFVKFQHPVIHWTIGYGFLKTRHWALVIYLLYLVIACLSEIVTQIVQGYHPTRTTMIVISLLFGTYLLARKNAFKPTV